MKLRKKRKISKKQFTDYKKLFGIHHSTNDKRMMDLGVYDRFMDKIHTPLDQLTSYRHS